MIVEHVRQAKRIAFVRFEQPFLALLDVKHIHRNIQLLQVLEQSPMVVAGHLHDHVDLGERHIEADLVNEGAKALTRVLKRQGWATLKPLIPGQQCSGNEAPNVGHLPNIDSHIQGFMGQHRNGLKLWARFRFSFHEQILSRCIPAHKFFLRIHWRLMKEDVPPVRLFKSSTLVKAKTSAPLPLPNPSCAALTQRALCVLSPHREGTRSRRCGRRRLLP